MARRAWIAAGLAVAFGVSAFLLHDHEGASASFSALTGFALGVVFQRSDFCFASGVRDLVRARRRRMALGILAALAAGTLGYAVVFGLQMPDPTGAYVPPTAFIARAGWHVVLGGFAFGAGMGIAGNCVSTSLFRIGEGSLAGPLTLAGAIVGFVLGYRAWPFLWSHAVATAPTVWIPHHVGYAAALAIQLALLAALALVVLWKCPPEPTVAAEPATPAVVARRILVERWPAWIGGVLVGLIATAAYLRTRPLGVTEELGRLARAWSGTVRLDGLDQIAGCTSSVQQGLGDNGWLVLSLVWGSLCAAIAAGQFRMKLAPARIYVRALAGGVLLGFGAMISVGCSIGVLLSGVMAMSLHGWIFAAAMVAGVWMTERVLPRG
jgi:uncharacterized membrane protein YedE/YeeE